MTQYLAVGGLESLIVEMCRNTDPARFDRSVLCLNDCSEDYRAELAAVGVHVDVLTRGHGSQLAHIRRIARHLRDRSVDVVHGHSGCRLQAMASARLARVAAAVYTAHGHPLERNWKTRIEDHVAIALTSAMVGVSRELVDDMKRRMPEGRSRIELIVNGVDTARFCPADGPDSVLRQRRSSGLPETGFLIGSVGRMTAVKNQATLVRALGHAVRTLDTDAHLVMVGDGELEADLRRQVEREDLVGRVHFLGSTRDVPAVLRALDAFAMCSYTEGTSMALLEAMSTGVVPVVSAVGGNLDVVTPGKDGFLHAPDDGEAFAATFATLAGDAEVAGRYQRAARATIEAAYSLDAMMGSYQSLYDRLLSRRRVTPGATSQDAVQPEGRERS